MITRAFLITSLFPVVLRAKEYCQFTVTDPEASCRVKPQDQTCLHHASLQAIAKTDLQEMSLLMRSL